MVLAARRDGRRPAASGDDGRRVLAFIAALYESAITGRAVTPDLLTPSNPFYHSMNGAPESPTRVGLGQEALHA
jgi:hypothetical protein